MRRVQRRFNGALKCVSNSWSLWDVWGGMQISSIWLAEQYVIVSWQWWVEWPSRNICIYSCSNDVLKIYEATFIDITAFCGGIAKWFLYNVFEICIYSFTKSTLWQKSINKCFDNEQKQHCHHFDFVSLFPIPRWRSIPINHWFILSNYTYFYLSKYNYENLLT